MKTKLSVLKVMGIVFALVGLLPAMPGVVQADVQPAPARILSAGLYHTCALTPGGAVDCWGSNWYGQSLDQPGPYTQVDAGYLHTCALTPGWAVDCWGEGDPENDVGQAADQPGPYSLVGAGVFHTCALTPSGSADCWGAPPSDWAFGQAVDQAGPYTQLGVGHYHNCGLKAGGAVECWGFNCSGQAVSQIGPYAQVTAGFLHSCALTPGGAVECWGASNYGQGQGRDGPYTQVSAGEFHTCALTPDGAVDCWGMDFDGQVSGTPGNNDGFATHPGPYSQVSAGPWHTCALTPSGAVDCWGWNNGGQAVDQPGPYGPYVPGGDTTPPVVAVTGVSEGAVYTLGAVPEAGCSTTDAESGVATEATLSLSGGTALDVGGFTATCSGAMDNAGNAADPVSVGYTVTFLFAGFTAPVDNPDVLNVAKAGQAVPLKWRLVDANGIPVTGLAEVSVTVVALACEQGENPDPVEEYAQGNSGLQNLGDGYYQWNWKTPRGYAGLCKTLKLDLGEGAGYEHLALFQFR